MKTALWDPALTYLLEETAVSLQRPPPSGRHAEDLVSSVGNLFATSAPSKSFQSLASKKLKKKSVSSNTRSAQHHEHPKALRRGALSSRMSRSRQRLSTGPRRASPPRGHLETVPLVGTPDTDSADAVFILLLPLKAV